MTISIFRVLLALAVLSTCSDARGVYASPHPRLAHPSCSTVPAALFRSQTLSAMAVGASRYIFRSARLTQKRLHVTGQLLSPLEHVVDTLSPAELRARIRRLAGIRQERAHFDPPRWRAPGAVRIVLMRRIEGRWSLLAGKRTAEVLVYPNTWCVPGGGVRAEETLESGFTTAEIETLVDANVLDSDPYVWRALSAGLRELKEETGIRGRLEDIAAALPRFYFQETLDLQTFVVIQDETDHTINLPPNEKAEFIRFHWVPIAPLLSQDQDLPWRTIESHLSASVSDGNTPEMLMPGSDHVFGEFSELISQAIALQEMGPTLQHRREGKIRPVFLLALGLPMFALAGASMAYAGIQWTEKSRLIGHARSAAQALRRQEWRLPQGVDPTPLIQRLETLARHDIELTWPKEPAFYIDPKKTPIQLRVSVRTSRSTPDPLLRAIMVHENFHMTPQNIAEIQKSQSAMNALPSSTREILFNPGYRKIYMQFIAAFVQREIEATEVEFSVHQAYATEAILSLKEYLRRLSNQVAQNSYLREEVSGLADLVRPDGTLNREQFALRRYLRTVGPDGIRMMARIGILENSDLEKDTQIQIAAVDGNFRLLMDHPVFVRWYLSWALAPLAQTGSHTPAPDPAKPRRIIASA